MIFVGIYLFLPNKFETAHRAAALLILFRTEVKVSQMDRRQRYEAVSTQFMLLVCSDFDIVVLQSVKCHSEVVIIYL